MINLSLLFAVALMLFAACSKSDGNDTLLPSPATATAFKAKYPDAAKVVWDEDGVYQKADFMNKGQETEAWFTAGGAWMLTVTDFTYAQLPDAVKTGFTGSSYADWTVEDAEMIERPGFETLYELDAEKAGSEMTLYFDTTGKLVKVLQDANNGHSPVVVTAAMKSTIQQQYPGAAIIDADLYPDGRTEVDILHAGILKEVIFTRTGAWEQTNWEVEESQVPQVVLDVLKGEAFQGYTVDDIEYVQWPDGLEYYRFELGKPGSVDMNVKIKPDGELVLS